MFFYFTQQMHSTAFVSFYLSTQTQMVYTERVASVKITEIACKTYKLGQLTRRTLCIGKESVGKTFREFAEKFSQLLCI